MANESEMGDEEAAVVGPPSPGDDADGPPVCRICLEKGTVLRPLAAVCACSGASGCVHRRCIKEWLKKRDHDILPIVSRDGAVVGKMEVSRDFNNRPMVSQFYCEICNAPYNGDYGPSPKKSSGPAAADGDDDDGDASVPYEFYKSLVGLIVLYVALTFAVGFVVHRSWDADTNGGTDPMSHRTSFVVVIAVMGILMISVLLYAICIVCRYRHRMGWRRLRESVPDVDFWRVL